MVEKVDFNEVARHIYGTIHRFPVYVSLDVVVTAEITLSSQVIVYEVQQHSTGTIVRTPHASVAAGTAADLINGTNEWYLHAGT